MAMRTIVLPIGKDWVEVKKEINYQSGDILVFNNHVSTNIILVEAQTKPADNARGVILSGYGQGRSAFGLPANTDNVFARSEDGLVVEMCVQTQ